MTNGPTNGPTPGPATGPGHRPDPDPGLAPDPAAAPEPVLDAAAAPEPASDPGLAPDSAAAPEPAPGPAAAPEPAPDPAPAPPPDPGAVRLREMRWWDIEPVLELEKDLFPEDAWSRGMFWSDLAHARGPEATRRYVVALDGDRIVGYAGVAAQGDVADIQTIAVARDHWGTGLGSLLLTELLRAATAFECAEVMLECRVDNLRAQKLYERFGFAPIGLRRGYYQPGNVDALVMRLTDPSQPASAQGTESNG